MKCLAVILFTLLGIHSMSEASLIMPIKKIPVTLDPQNYVDIYSMVGMLQVHRGIFKFLPNLEFANDLAESYQVLDEGRRVVFKLKKSKFSNGEEIKALHVERSFKRHFKLKSGFAGDLDYLKNGKSILQGTLKVDQLGVKALDEHTVEFLLARPTGIFFSHLATVDSAILPLKEDLRYDWKKDGGAGVYTLSAYSEKSMILQARQGLVSKEAPQKIELKALADVEAQAEALAGRVDSLDGYSVPEEVVKTLLSRGWKTSVSTMTRQLFLVVNSERVPREIRQALADRIKSLDFDLTSPSYKRSAGIIPFGLPGSFGPPRFLSPKITKLKPRKTYSLMIVNAEPLIPSLAEQIKKSLGGIGIDIEVRVVGMEEYLPSIRNKKFDIMLRSKFLDYPDGYSILSYFKSEYSENTFFINDKKVDELLAKSTTELNILKRAEIYREIQTRILRENTVIPLVFGSDNRGLWGPKVLAVEAHPLGIQGLPLAGLKLERQ